MKHISVITVMPAKAQAATPTTGQKLTLVAQVLSVLGASLVSKDSATTSA